MAQINISASELNVVKQRIQNRYAKIELLNSNMQVVDSLTGVLNGSTSVDATSDMRRSATIKIVITDSSFEVEAGGKIFLDKLICLYIGTFSIIENEIIYTKIGTFVIDAPTYEYDISNNSIQLSLLDLMCKLSGIRNGYLPGIQAQIPAGTNIRQVMISTLALGGFTKYVCEEAPSPGVVPMDMSFAQGSTVYTILSALRDIYPNYEIYFDVDGVFHYNKIPTGANEPVQIDDTLWESIVISEKVDVDYQYVKNYIEVWGRTHDPAYYPTSVTRNGSNITLDIAEVVAYSDGIIYGFTLPTHSDISSPKIQINSLGYKNVLLDDGSAATIDAETGETYYCVQYISATNSFRWLGHLQAYAEAKDDNPNSPFNINSSVGIIRLPLYGGDYDNCLTDDLALQRAKYELYLHTTIQDTITITCIPIPWLDVNVLVDYTLQRNGQKHQYLIKSFSYGFDIDDTMTVTMSRYYPDYPDW